MSQYPVHVVLGPRANSWAWVLGSAAVGIAVCIAVCNAGSLENQGPGIEPRDGPRVLISDEASCL